MVPAGQDTWKWPKHTDRILYQSQNLLKNSPPETESGASGYSMFQFPDMWRKLLIVLV